MIQDYSDPKVTLNQIYAAVTSGTSATLGACVIGPSYKVCSFKSNGQDVRISAQDYVAASGIAAVAYPLRKASDGAVDTAKVRVSVRQAYLNYQTFDSDSKIIELTGATLTVADDQANYVVFSGSGCLLPVQVQPGDKVLLKTGDTVKVDQVAAIEKDSDGAATKIALTYNTALTGITQVKFARYVESAYVDSAKISATASTVAVLANPTVTTSLEDQTETAYPIYSGSFYVQYRSFNKTFVGKVVPIAATTDGQIQDVLGQVSELNPLALAVACATAAADSNFVYFTAVGYDAQISDATIDQTLSKAYAAAMDLVEENDAVHGIVPCTTNKAILRQLLNAVNTASDQQIPHFKYLYASTAIPEVAAVQQFTGANNTLIVGQIIQNKVFADRRGIITFADGPMHNGIDVPPYCVAAAFAGLRSASYPHAPLSNVVLPGIETKQEHGFTASQLKSLGANGFLRVGRNSAGNTIVRRQLTSAAADDVNYDQQSIVCNIDSICLNLKNSGTGYVGNTNISQELLSLLQVELQDRLRAYSIYVNALIGPQLLSWRIVNLAQHPVYKDRVYVTIQGEPPKPFNRFDITFRMI